MIAETDQYVIQTLCQKYGAKRALLFGSNLDPRRKARDIDLAVEGIAPGDFFAFCGEVICGLSTPVDVVDLSGRSKFLDLIRREGVPVYG